jgi:hypothetical protein
LAIYVQLITSAARDAALSLTLVVEEEFATLVLPSLVRGFFTNFRLPFYSHFQQLCTEFDKHAQQTAAGQPVKLNVLCVESGQNAGESLS